MHFPHSPSRFIFAQKLIADIPWLFSNGLLHAEPENYEDPISDTLSYASIIGIFPLFAIIIFE